jgi:hypothetical protein
MGAIAAVAPVPREHWLELNAMRRQRQSCADDVAAIKQSCRATCGKPSIADCKDCYPKLISRLRQRYCDTPDKEWFDQRGAVREMLDAMLADAKDHPRDGLGQIEESIAAEKEAWYRWVWRMFPEHLKVADRSIDAAALRKMLDDADGSIQELVACIWQGLGQPADWSAQVDALEAKVTAVHADPAALKELYASHFFTDKATSKLYENAKAYQAQYLASPGLAMDQVLDKLREDYKEDMKTRPRISDYQSQLDALSRAQMAYEQKMKDKANPPSNGLVVSEKLYDLPPCHVCKAAVDTKDVLSCTVCQAARQMGAASPLTVYCSEACFHSGHVSHHLTRTTYHLPSSTNIV